MDLQTEVVRDIRERLNFVTPVYGAELTRLAQAKCRRHHFVITQVPGGLQCNAKTGRIQLAVFAIEIDQLRAGGKKFRRSAFVGIQVRMRVTEHRPVWRADLRECKCVRCSPGSQRPDLNACLEDIGESLTKIGRQRVLSIGMRRAFIGGRESFHYRRCYRHLVVAAKINCHYSDPLLTPGSGWCGQCRNSLPDSQAGQSPATKWVATTQSCRIFPVAEHFDQAAPEIRGPFRNEPQHGELLDYCRKAQRCGGEEEPLVETEYE